MEQTAALSGQTRKQRTTSLLDLSITLVLASIFLLSAVDKMLHYGGFVDALRNYVLTPAGWAPLLATPVIVLEIILGIGLLARPWRQPAALLAAGSLGLFTLAVATNFLFGDRGICGCWFTVTLAQGTVSHLILNGILITLALMVWSSLRNSATASEGRS